MRGHRALRMGYMSGRAGWGEVIGVMAGCGFAVAYRTGTGVVWAVIAGPGGSGVNTQEGWTGKGLCGARDVQDRPRKGDGVR